MLPWEDLRMLLMPPSVYCRRRIAWETLSGEPELALLPDLMPSGGTAIDVGANQGFRSKRQGHSASQQPRARVATSRAGWNFFPGSVLSRGVSVHDRTPARPGASS